MKNQPEEFEFSQTKLSRQIRVLPKTVNENCRGKRGISAQMAVCLSLALGASPQLRLNLQKNWELSQVNGKKLGTIEKLAAQK